MSDVYGCSTDVPLSSPGRPATKKMYNDLQALNSEMRENQSLREELLESKMELRRLRAEFDALLKGSPTFNPKGAQGPMPADEALPKSAAFPQETSRQDNIHKEAWKLIRRARVHEIQS